MQINEIENHLSLPKGIVLNKDERSEICKIIKSAIRKIYKQPDYTENVVMIDGVEIEMQYMNKAINNRLLLKKIVYDSRNEIQADINTKKQLYDFVKENTHNLFHPNGSYFKCVYSLLSSTTTKGNQAEELAFAYVEEISRKKGLEIKVLKPKKVTDDVYLGIDGYFMYNEREITIQIKPLAYKMSSNLEIYKKNPEYWIAYCDGYIKPVSTDYLVLIDNKTSKCYMFKTNAIIPKGSYFLIPKNNIIKE